MLLALDTSTRSIGIAIYDGVFVRTESVWISQNYHSVELASGVRQALSRGSITVDELEALGVAIGPGSFTGLRVGMAFAKGLALARHIAMIGIPTLDAVAQSHPLQDTPLAAVLEAGRGRLAVGWYQVQDGSWKSNGQVELLTPGELNDRIVQPTAITGELSARVRKVLGRKYKSAQLASPARSLRRPGFLAELAWNRWQAGERDNPATLAPFYLHHTQASPP
jgi:tRNA threonylcarbamoyladenosine biosynthesis protein TsaB